MRAIRTLLLFAIVAIAVGVPAASAGSQGTSAAEEATAKATPATATAREPKDLEARFTIVMGENSTRMYYGSAKGKPSASFTVPAGKTVGIKVLNRGKLEHELLFGRKYDAASREYGQNLFGSLTADLFTFRPVKMEIAGATFEELEVEPGGELWIRAVFPKKTKGKWEIGCMIEGHYEAGMVAAFVIR